MKINLGRTLLVILFVMQSSLIFASDIGQQNIQLREAINQYFAQNFDISNIKKSLGTLSKTKEINELEKDTLVNDTLKNLMRSLKEIKNIKDFYNRSISITLGVEHSFLGTHSDKSKETIFISVYDNSMSRIIELLSADPKNEPVVKEQREKEESQLSEILGDKYLPYNQIKSFVCKGLKNKKLEGLPFGDSQLKSNRQRGELTVNHYEQSDIKNVQLIEVKFRAALSAEVILDNTKFSDFYFLPKNPVLSFKLDAECNTVNLKRWNYLGNKWNYIENYGPHYKLLHRNYRFQQVLPLEQINFDLSVEDTSSPKTLIGLIDSGIDYNHPNLAFKIPRPQAEMSNPEIEKAKEVLANRNDYYSQFNKLNSELRYTHIESNQKLLAKLEADQLATQEQMEASQLELKEKTKKYFTDVKQVFAQINTLNDLPSWKKLLPQHERQIRALSKEIDKLNEDYNSLKADHASSMAKANSSLESIKSKIIKQQIEIAQYNEKETELKRLSTIVDDAREKLFSQSIGWNFREENNLPYDFSYNVQSLQNDSYDHGTHVAGIALRNFSELGIVPFSYDVVDKNDLYFAVKFAVQRGARVINLSLGSNSLRDWEGLAKGIQENPNVIFVCAAGNEGSNNELVEHFPSSLPFDNIIAVASTNSEHKLSKFSNFGTDKVDIAAEGEFIDSLVPGGGRGLKSGTSMATPQVTRTVARMLNANPDLTSQEVIEILERTSIKTDELGLKIKFGGYLNEEAAIKLAEEI